MTLDFFRRQGVIHPELCFVVSAAVGFPVSVYVIRAEEGRRRGEQYQVMRWDESPGPGLEFWDWYLWERPQRFDTPELAAAAFVEGWLEWSKKNAV